jgi:hypothetical protein
MKMQKIVLGAALAAILLAGAAHAASCDPRDVMQNGETRGAVSALDGEPLIAIEGTGISIRHRSASGYGNGGFSMREECRPRRVAEFRQRVPVPKAGEPGVIVVGAAQVAAVMNRYPMNR